MAAQLGCERRAPSRGIGSANGLKPHLVRGFKLSRDPQFVEKLEDVVGLYLYSARARAGALLRREEPDPGARPHAAGPADEEGPCGDDDARLQAPRHDHAVRRAEHAGRQGDRDRASSGTATTSG